MPVVDMKRANGTNSPKGGTDGDGRPRGSRASTIPHTMRSRGSSRVHPGSARPIGIVRR
jgi:hypothetical protein